MRRRLWAAAALVAAITGAGLTACSAGYTDGARPGVAYAGGGGTIDSPQRKVVVQLPIGPLTLETGKPVRTVSTGHSPNRAADGARFVPVAWTLGGGGAQYGNNEPAFQFQVTLVADGKRYDLQAGHDGEQAASPYQPIVTQKYVDVVVAGAGEHLQVDVEYDGLTQTVDVDSGKIQSGVAAPLYQPRAPHIALTQSACPLVPTVDKDRFEPSTGTTCTVGAVTLTPYVGGLGWVSSAAQSWVLVPLDLHLIEIDDRESSGRYGNFDIQQLQVTVDGKAPTTEILRYNDPDPFAPLRGGVYVFRATSKPGQLRVTTSIRTENEYRTGQFHTFRHDQVFPLA